LKKTITVALVAIFLFLVVSCGTDSKSVVGRWGLPEEQQERMKEEYGEEYAEISANIYYEFKDDGTVTMGGNNKGEEYSQSFGYTVDGDEIYIDGIYVWYVLDGDRLLQDGEPAMVRL